MEGVFFEILARERFFVCAAVSRLERLGNQVRADSLLLQILAHAPLTQLLVFVAQARIGFSKRLIVKIALLFEARDDGCNGGLALRARFRARGHERRSSTSVRMRRPSALTA